MFVPLMRQLLSTNESYIPTC